ncbi:hypothetical protein FRC20_001401 [Serendipita sp. 405]|nr:hypothetical protein FRC15_001407 [Serendipita sp. 397]KAG8876501.1 hypothetical protein FRC20_001401 [Serendipita sp. 405]
MPFCRYCGDLVLKDRCGKCGGRPVAASFSWNPGKTNPDSMDRWKQTYTEEKASQKDDPPPSRVQIPPPSKQGTMTTSPIPVTPVRNFPRPQKSLNTRISAHITATTSNERSPSPTKRNAAAQLVETLNSSPSGNPILDDGVSLSKVYGSVLQNPETLRSYACAECESVFTRDATLYPDPEQPMRMLCRHCFLSSAGVKGECAACQKPVFMLKQEGQFVENGGRCWHTNCFVCEGCFKNIARNPSVDLYGRPCCPECFDTSLHRSSRSKNSSPHKNDDEKRRSMGDPTKESMATMEELSRRLGVQSKESTPSKAPLQLSPTTPTAGPRKSISQSSITDRVDSKEYAVNLAERLRRSSLGSQASTTPEKVATSRNSMQDRGGLSSPKAPAASKTEAPNGISPHRRPALQSISTPDLTSDVSDDAESAWPSPPTPKADATSGGLEDPDALCDKCNKPLYSIVGGGRIVTVPPEAGQSGRYHSACFICAKCDEPFTEKDGSAPFVITDDGLTHTYCAPPPKTKIITRQRPLSIAPIIRPEPPVPVSRPVSALPPRPTSSLSSAPAYNPANVTVTDSKRCAGCHRTVAMFEPGVVPGPNGSRWHASCLVCGGKGARRQRGEPGCGKKLDRDAKLDREGKTWCSSCTTLIILNGTGPSTTARTPVSATYTGSSWVSSQFTGSSSVADHSTGSSTSTVQDRQPVSRPLSSVAESASSMLERRGSISPTKGMLGGTVPVNRTLSTKRASRPRPKSVSVLPSLAALGSRAARLGLVHESDVDNSTGGVRRTTTQM